MPPGGARIELPKCEQLCPLRLTQRAGPALRKGRPPHVTTVFEVSHVLVSSQESDRTVLAGGMTLCSESPGRLWLGGMMDSRQVKAVI